MNGDWRGELESAVAFRMVERNPESSFDSARVRVSDVAKYGMNSNYHAEVVAAVVDLYGAAIATAIPFLRAMAQTIVIETQAQNARGRAARPESGENLR